MQKLDFFVGGMMCSACSDSVKKAVSKINGVKSAEVFLLSKSMTVILDENITPVDDILKAVRKIGFSIFLQNDSDHWFQDKQKEDKQEVATLKKRVFISLLFLLPMIAVTHYSFSGLQSAKFFSHHPVLYISIQILLLLPILVVNRHFFLQGFRRLFLFSPDMDSLIAVGTGAGIAYSMYTIIRFFLSAQNIELSDELYFDTSAMIPTFISAGKYLEAKCKIRTGSALAKLVSLVPRSAVVEQNGLEVELPYSKIEIGDIVILRSGDTIATDGTVIEGVASIDQSAVTGESIPLDKYPGTNVISGSVCLSGNLKYRTEKTGKDSVLSQMISLVRDAANSKAPIARLADKASRIFVPTVLVISALTFCAWLSFSFSLDMAVKSAIAVLVISCPCALGLATPAAIMTGTGRAAELGILFKNAATLESLHNIQTAVFDKTGTLTEGMPTISDIECFEIADKAKLLSVAASIEHYSEHPFAKSICQLARKEQVQILKSENCKTFPGLGFSVTLTEKNEVSSHALAGNMAFLHSQNIPVPEHAEQIASRFAESGKTPVSFAYRERLIGIIAFTDAPRLYSAQTIESLKNRNINTILLTGDNRQTAQALAKRIGIDDVHAEILPQEKADEIKRLSASGKKIAMIGDGINDAPALVSADIGIAIGSGTDVAIASADVILTNSNPFLLIQALELSKAVVQNIKANLFWAFFYNSLGIPLAAGVFYPLLRWQLSPSFGALAMSISSLFVVTNALRLKKFQPTQFPALTSTVSKSI